MDKEEIIKAHPSICYNCSHARKPAADENRDKGYVGCSIPARDGKEEERVSYSFIKDAKELATGWVDLRSIVFGEKSGIISNCQLLTLEVGGCSHFQQL